MKVLEEFKPLYFDDYSIADSFGGRAGARSYSISQHALYELLHSETKMRGFFLREVHSTIYSSMWRDLKDRIEEYEEIHGVDLSSVIHMTDNKQGENTIVNTLTGSSITTKGFKVSSSNQTASLKSLAGATHVYIDEADEVSKDDFLKLRLSLRKKGVKLRILRAFNPPEREHWIWDSYELRRLSEEEIFDRVYRLLKLSNLGAKKVKQILATNNKVYYEARPKNSDHISINTNFGNNLANLNDQAIKVYLDLFEEDVDYFLVNIVGLVPNIGGEIVYYRYDKHENDTDREIQPNDVLHIGMDFNITNMSAVIHVVENSIRYAVAEETRIFDTEQMCALLKEKYHNHKMIIYPDATGAGRKTSSGKSDHDIIRSFGLSIRSGASNPEVRNRINTMNSKFQTKEYLVNRHTCPEYSMALSKLKYKGGAPDKTSGYDHLPDAGGYFITQDYAKTKNRKLMF